MVVSDLETGPGDWAPETSMRNTPFEKSGSLELQLSLSSCTWMFRGFRAAG